MELYEAIAKRRIVRDFKDEDVPQIISWAMKEANPLYPVPVLWGREEFRQFIDKVRA